MSAQNIESVVAAIAGYPIDFSDSSTDPTVSIHEINELFQRLHACAQTSSIDPARSVVVKEIGQFAHPIYCHVFILIQHLKNSRSYNVELLFNSVAETQQSLSKILRLSFNEDYRKAEVSLGLVGAISQLLILDVAVFGLARKDRITQESRRLIGNILTNLTFGNIKVKLNMCAHIGFLDIVTQIIDGQDELLQAYAALIRNLSWNADSRMTQALAKTVPALTRAGAVKLQDLHQDEFARKSPHDDNKALLAVLSALWNLASHSIENKKAICSVNFPARSCPISSFQHSVVTHLDEDPEKRYSGNLSYSTEAHRSLSTEYIVIDFNMSANDPPNGHFFAVFLADRSFFYIMSIGHFFLCYRRRALFTSILTDVTLIAYLTGAFLFLLIINLTNNPDKITFVENATGILKYVSGYISEREHLLKIVHEAKIVKHLLSLLSSSSFTVVLNVLGSLCALVSRDRRSQMKLAQNEQARMILESLRNSSRDDVRNGVRLVLNHLNSSPLSGFAMTLPSTGRLREMRTSYDANIVPSHMIANQQLLPYRQVSQSILSPDTPVFFDCTSNNSYPPCSSRQNFATLDKSSTSNKSNFVENGLTDSQTGTCNGSIQSLNNDVPTNWQSNITTTRNSGNQSPISPSLLPDSPSNLFLNDNRDEDQIDEDILTDAINMAMPRPNRQKNHPTQFYSIDDGTGILTEAIESVMPKPRIRRRDRVNLRSTNQRVINNALEQSALLIAENTTEKVRDASMLESQKFQNDDSFEDNFIMADMSYTVFPQDVDAELQAEQIVIDCLNITSDQKPRVIARPTQLDATEAQLKKVNRSARVSPFNYKKPAQNLPEKSEKLEKCQKNSKASITVANL